MLKQNKMTIKEKQNKKKGKTNHMNDKNNQHWPTTSRDKIARCVIIQNDFSEAVYVQ